MSYYQKRIDDGPVLDDYCVSDDQMLGNLCRNSSRPMSPKGQLEQEKRMRREIANSNERRRMQSINAGFNSLKNLLPHPDGEKLSKAAILMQTADYISSLEKDKNRLSTQNSQLKRLLGELDDGDYGQVSPPPKRKKRDTESSDEGINMPALDDPTPLDLKREMIDIRGQLDRERCLRMMLEDQIRGILNEAQMCPDKLRHIATQVSQQMRHQVLRQKFLEDERRKQEIHEVKVAVKDEIKSPLPDLKTPIQEVTPVETAPKVCATTTPPVPRNKAFLNSYMSRRNLDMIVEAIRHLEGEQALLDQPVRDNHHRDIPNSEDSEKDSHSTATLSDQEDCFSGRDSPLQPQLQATLHVQHNGHVLLGDPTLLQCPLPTEYMSRPGVIVQTTSS